MRPHLQYVSCFVRLHCTKADSHCCHLTRRGPSRPPLATAIAGPCADTLFTTLSLCILFWGFPNSSVSKESACNAGAPGLIPGSGRSPGERNGNPLQCSCLENPMDRENLQATVHEVARVRPNLVTKPPLPHSSTWTLILFTGPHWSLHKLPFSHSVDTNNQY